MTLSVQLRSNSNQSGASGLANVPTYVIERLGPLMPSMLACGFFAVLFLQSGLDKVFDRKGNLAWMTPHFEKSPFRGKVPLFLSMLTVLEVGTGLANTLGLAGLLFDFSSDFARYGLWLAGFTLLCLFAGQRLAKDYAGAASLAGYFAAALIGIIAAVQP